MTSILDRVFRIISSWKTSHQELSGAQNELERVQLNQSNSQAHQHQQHQQQQQVTSSLSSSLLFPDSSSLNQNELINLNSYPSQQQDSHFYYAINDTRSSLIQTDILNRNQFQLNEMNSSNNNSSNARLNLANIRVSFSLPSTNRRRSSSHRSARRSLHPSSSSTRSTTRTNNPIVTSSISSSSSSSSRSSNNYDLFSFLKKRERNFLSAICAVFCIAVLSVSLIETRWFFLNGGGCNLNYIGVAHFFAPGRLEYQIETSKISKNDIVVYNFILPNGLVLKNCANKEIIIIMRTVIAFVFLAIFSSCIGLMLDTFGFMKSGIKLVRRHAIFHILTVIFCLAINGFCFWITERMNEQQNETRFKKGKKVDVSFDVSYYLIVLASGLSILATAFTLIRRYPPDDDDQLERLLEEYTGFEEPLHLERSLPANSVQANFLNQNDFCLNNIVDSNNNFNNQENFSNRASCSHQIRSPPPPPSTPPPSLHSSGVYQPVVISEPPPPYDPAPALA